LSQRRFVKSDVSGWWKKRTEAGRRGWTFARLLRGDEAVAAAEKREVEVVVVMMVSVVGAHEGEGCRLRERGIDESRWPRGFAWSSAGTARERGGGSRREREKERKEESKASKRERKQER